VLYTVTVGIGLYICAAALPAKALTFAPPRSPEPAYQNGALDANASTQLSVINTLEKKISTGFSPWIISNILSIDTARSNLGKKYESELARTKPKTFSFYWLTVVGYIFSNGYVLYALLAILILTVARIILRRFNFIA
jgi:hypothetical protein